MSDTATGFSLTSADGGDPIAIEGQATLGRGKDCTVSIDATSVSRKHGMLEIADGKMTYTDLGSSNGSKVNGVAVSSATVLYDGDELVLGDNSFSVQCPYGRDAAAADDEPKEEATQLLGAVEEATQLLGGAAEPPPTSAASAPEPAPAPAAAEAEVPAMWSDSAGLEGSTQFFSAGQAGADESIDVPANADVPRLVAGNAAAADLVVELGAPGAEARTWKIGRDAACDIVLSHDSVSGQHAQLVNEGERWKVVNWMSTNGVFVNGTRGLSTYLKAGDRIELGTVELVLQLPAAGGSGAEKKGFFSRLFGRG